MIKFSFHQKDSLKPASRNLGVVGCLLGVFLMTFALSSLVHAQSFSVLYTFTGSTDGAFPEGNALFLDSDGNIYGTTGEYGATETTKCTKLCGNVFKLTPHGKETNLHTFNGETKGYIPSGVVMDKSGNLYGPVAYGGPKGDGFLFELNKAGKLTVLHGFPSHSGDGEVPGNIFLDPTGDIYGLTAVGGVGNGCPGYGCGTVFKLDQTDKETIYDLSIAAWAPSGLLRGADGTLYGTTVNGGVGCQGVGCGTVFKMDKTGKLTVLHKFRGAPDGAIPEGNLALDKAGNLYGTTWQGGNAGPCPPSGCGTVYKISKTGKETILHKFSLADGASPTGGVVLDASGNLYGTTTIGGSNCPVSGCGTVFKVDKSGTETVLYSFTGKSDGSEPFMGLALDKSGNLYGTAFYGGESIRGLCFPSGCGTIFKVTP